MPYHEGTLVTNIIDHDSGGIHGWESAVLTITLEHGAMFNIRGGYNTPLGNSNCISGTVDNIPTAVKMFVD